MSARVYLMADFGKGPRAVPGRYGMVGRDVVRIERGEPTRWEFRDRIPWWLVEAESADAARECIALYQRVPNRPHPFTIIDNTGAGMGGRIIASGGAK